MRIESKKTSYYCCVVCVFTCVSLKSKRISMRKVTIRSMCERRKKDTLVVVSPQNKGLFWDAESHDGKKKEKTVGSKSPKKLVFSPVLEKDFVSCDTLFGCDEKSYLQ